MTKLQERQTSKTHEVLPELPEGVVVPDDARSLKFPDSIEHRRTATGVRWMPWFAALIVIAMVGALVGVLAGRDGETEYTIRTRSSELIQQSTDEALAEQQAVRQLSAYEMVQQSIDEALAERQAFRQLSAYEMVQQSINEALAEQQAAASVRQLTAYELVQQSIDEALAERQSLPPYADPVSGPR